MSKGFEVNLARSKAEPLKPLYVATNFDDAWRLRCEVCAEHGIPDADYTILRHLWAPSVYAIATHAKAASGKFSTQYAKEA